MRSFRVVVAASLAACSWSELGAQGSLGALGFGYPVGGTSTRAAGTAASFGEFDPLSPINPASLGGLPRTVITAQTEPEFRTLRVGTSKEKSTVQRVPLIMLAVPVRAGVAVSVSASTLLDRSYTTITRTDVILNGSTVQSTDQNDVRGAIGNLRVAAGWRINDRFSVGVAGHLLTGDNLLVRTRTFDDTSSFGSVLDSSRVVYFGTALSVGGEWRVRRGLAAMASYRKGNSMDVRVTDTVRASANVPNRVGLGIRFDGIPGSVFALGMERQDWSRMRALGSSLVQARDVTNWHGGAEVAGPRLRGLPVLVRAGYAKNALPFGVDGNVVDESRFTAGLGLPIAREQASLDLSLQRANRTLVGGTAKESSWLFGVGVQIRP
ncbi:MAG: hypothetical protein IT353_03690 [Gemmatimonadaceae bacterium]|nr:hypothetical protein [Gemmatimonadaceae bacterium]